MILDGQSQSALDEAARRLAAGQLVAFPTETVYGLGADAANDAAVGGIFRTKGRPADHPLIVHVSDPGRVDDFASAVPGFARSLMAAFWPGPLTVILPRRQGVAAAAAGGQSSVGVRCPSHAVAQALLRACANVSPPILGLAGPSANRFGRVSPTTAAHVLSEFGDLVPVLDGGACEVGIESTIIDCTRAAPVLLRPGAITREQIERACGQRLLEPEEMASPAPRASGSLQSHYAPDAKLRLMDAAALQTALDLLGADASHLAVYARFPLRTRAAGILLRRMPDDAAEVARQLFAVLREFDAQGIRLIWVETPPAGSGWAGVRDRLERAAAG